MPIEQIVMSKGLDIGNEQQTGMGNQDKPNSKLVINLSKVELTQSRSPY